MAWLPVLQTDEWCDERNWSGWVANKFLYPSNTLRIEDTNDLIEEMDLRCESDILKASRKLAKEENAFKLAVKRGASQRELERIALLMSNIDGRRGQLLDQRNRYQSALQQIESIKGMTDQTVIMRKLAGICKSVNMSMPMHRTREIERQYSQSMTQLRYTADSIDETFQDEDEEAENKVADAATLVDKYKTALNLQISETFSPIGAPGQEKLGSGGVLDKRDEELCNRVDNLSK